VQRVPLALVGASSKAHSPAQQSGRTINLYPEANGPDAKAIVALRAVPGAFRKLDLSTDLPELAARHCRGLHTMGERAFGAYGNKVVEFFSQGTPPDTSVVYIVVCTLNTHTGPVGFSDNAGKLVIGDGPSFYTVDLDTNVLSPVITVNGEPLRGYWSVFLNQQTIYVERGTTRYYSSDVGDPTTVDDLSFASAESDDDPIVRAFELGGYLVLLGSETMEPHKNYGEADNPFLVVKGYENKVGVVGNRAACIADNALYFVGRSQGGSGQVWRWAPGAGVPEKVSASGVEDALAKVLFTKGGQSDDITMWSYQEGSHEFVVINMPAAEATSNNHAKESKTWVFDVAMPPELGWHERGYMNPDTGRFERGLGDYHIAWKGRHYTGAYDAPHLYEESLDYYRQNTDPLVKLRESAGPLNLGGRRFTVHKVGIEMEVGIGRDAGVQGSDPQLILRYSWDSGKTWSNEIFRSAGKIGAGKTQVFFGPCGSGRDFNVQAIYSEPTRFTLTGGWADVTVGR
jgi:hypothetical protein